MNILKKDYLKNIKKKSNQPKGKNTFLKNIVNKNSIGFIISNKTEINMAEIKEYEKYLNKKINIAMPSGFNVPLKKLNPLLLV